MKPSGCIPAGLALLTAFTQAQENILSPDEAAAGYDLLFDGATLTGWHGYRMTTVPAV